MHILPSFLFFANLPNSFYKSRKKYGLKDEFFQQFFFFKLFLKIK
jgi:hypothetical protein